MRTAYAVAFSGDRFLMVWHSRRHGWEMPGGHVEEGETSAQAAAREFKEEAGYRIEVLETRDIGYCDVCAAVLGEKVAEDCEMESRLFSELPEQLSFDREEYEDTVPWARSIVDRHESDRRALRSRIPLVDPERNLGHDYEDQRSDRHRSDDVAQRGRRSHRHDGSGTPWRVERVRDQHDGHGHHHREGHGVPCTPHNHVHSHGDDR